MKKLLCVLLTLIFTASCAAGCAGGPSGGTGTETTGAADAVTAVESGATSTAEETTAEATTEEPETEPVTFEEFVVTPDEEAVLAVPRVFGDHMVLQRDEKIKIWGTSNKDGTKIRGLFMGDEARGVTTDGKWEMTFSPKEATAEPQTLTIDDSCGNTVMISDILVGDVWLIGGQSNAEISLAEYPTMLPKIKFDDTKPLRIFMQGARYVIDHRSEAAEPCDDIVNPAWRWKKADRSAGAAFSALGWFFANRILEETGVPIGMISVAASGAKINEFMPQKLVDKYKYRMGGNVGPSEFYNALVHPFAGLRFKAMIFFQGESEGYPAANPQAKNYSRDFTALMDEYRAEWGFDFPVYNVQLSDYSTKGASFSPNSGQVRAQQYTAYRNMTGVRLIPSYDLGSEEGDPNYMHPPYKKELADRIAALALADMYGIGSADDALAPEFEEITISEDKTYVTVKFSRVGEGLISSKGDNVVSGFIIGTLGKQHAAEAEIISKDTVKVYVPSGAKLSGVGFMSVAHMTKGEPLLFNSNGLPALAFYRAIK